MMDPSTRLRESACRCGCACQISLLDAGRLLFQTHVIFPCRGRTYEVREIIANEGGQVNKTDDDGFYAGVIRDV